MPTKTTITLYTLEELKAKGENDPGYQRALAWMRETEAEMWEGSDILEGWRGALEAIGFSAPDIYYSGFSSQGDGAGFICERISLPDMLTYMSGINPSSYDWRELTEARPAYNPRWRRLTVLMPWLSLSISHSGRYYHAQSFSIDHTLYVNREYPRLENMLANFIGDALEELRQSLCDAIYHDLESSYRAALEDENLEDLAAANEYTFCANGDRFDA